MGKFVHSISTIQIGDIVDINFDNKFFGKAKVIQIDNNILHFQGIGQLDKFSGCIEEFKKGEKR